MLIVSNVLFLDYFKALSEENCCFLRELFCMFLYVLWFLSLFSIQVWGPDLGILHAQIQKVFSEGVQL